MLRILRNLIPHRLYHGVYNYRIGDAVYHSVKYPQNTVFRNTICSKYIKAQKADQDLKCLNAIILNHNKNKPSRNILRDNIALLHVRIGDVFGLLPNQSVDDIWYSDSDNYDERGRRYIRGKAYYKNIVNELKAHCSHIDTIVITSASHRPLEYPDYCRSMKYLDHLKGFLESHNFAIIENYGKHPDCDLQLASLSKVVIISGGGYSRLLGEIARLNSNTVLGEADWT